MDEFDVVDIEMSTGGFSGGERMLVDVDSDDVDIGMLQRSGEREASFVPTTDINLDFAFSAPDVRSAAAAALPVAS